MHQLEALADLSIRRACGFVGFAMLTAMLSLSFDPLLAFRTGAWILALTALGLAIVGWRTPRRDIRRSEVYTLLRSAGLPRERLNEPATRLRIANVLHARLVWHAERVALAAMAFWALAGGVALRSAIMAPG